MKYIIILLSIFLTQPIFSQIELNVLSHWTSPTIKSKYGTKKSYNEVWGLAMRGKEYAVIGSYDGTHIVDITDPTTPNELFYFSGRPNSVHRDYHDYNGYLYIVCGEGGGMQIADLQYLPDSLPIVYDSKKLISVSHNIFIDSTNAKLYTVGGSSIGAVTTFDISNPKDPVKIGTYTDFGGKKLYSSHDVFVKNDTAYINAEKEGLIIADFSNDTTITTINYLPTEDYPYSGYNHSGWLSPDNKTYVMADETYGKDVKIFDVSNLPEMELLTTIKPTEDENFIAHNPIIKGEYAYISFYDYGLQVWNIADPEKPIKSHFYIPPFSPRTWGIYPFLPSGNLLISDMYNGLYVLDGSSLQNSVIEPNKRSNHELNIYPNPAKGSISIGELNNANHAKYEILDISGKNIINGTIDITERTAKIELPINLYNGIYIINIITDQNIYNGKIIVE